MSSFVVPGKFAFLHMPKTGGTWFTENVRSQCEIIELTEHAARRHIPEQFLDLPIISIVRESADWLESYFNYAVARCWDSGTTIDRTSQAETCDKFAINLMKNHPRVLEDHVTAYADGADFVIDYLQLQEQSRSVLRQFGLDVVLLERVNETPRTSQLSIGVQDQWRIHNANLAERYGWPLPVGFIFTLDDWTGWWRQTCELLSPMFHGRPVSFLEIGVCEGRSAKIAFESILQHPDSSYVGIDIWLLNPARRAKKNIQRAAAGREFHVMTANLPHMDGMRPAGLLLQCKFDVIYVDGDHSEQGCYADLVDASRLIQDGGVIVVDDYGCQEFPSDHPGVKAATDRFFSNDPRFRELTPPHDDFYQKPFVRIQDSSSSESL